MSAPVRFFWDGKEVPEAEYLRRKFCLCGALNASDRLMCARCLKSARAALSAQSPASGAAAS